MNARRFLKIANIWITEANIKLMSSYSQRHLDSSRNVLISRSSIADFMHAASRIQDFGAILMIQNKSSCVEISFAMRPSKSL